MDNASCREQIADLLLKDPMTGEDLSIVSTLHEDGDGFSSFEAQAGPDSPKWRIEFRMSEV